MPEGERRDEERKTVAAPDYSEVKAGQEQSEVKIERYVRGIDNSGIHNLQDMVIAEQAGELDNAMDELAALDANDDGTAEHSQKVDELSERIRQMESALQKLKDERRQTKEAADSKRISEVRETLASVDEEDEVREPTMRVASPVQLEKSIDTPRIPVKKPKKSLGKVIMDALFGKEE